MSDAQFDLLGVTEKEYKEWCKENNLYSSKVTSKKLFYQKILKKEIVRDLKTNKLKTIK